MSKSRTSLNQVSSQYLRIDSKKSITSNNQNKGSNIIETMSRLESIITNKAGAENDELSLDQLDLNLIISQFMSNKKSEKAESDFDVDLNSSEFKNFVFSQLESTTPKQNTQTNAVNNLPQLNLNLALLTNKNCNYTTGKKKANQNSGDKLLDNLCDEEWEKILGDGLNEMNVIPETKEENNQSNQTCSLISAVSIKSEELALNGIRPQIANRQIFEFQKVEEIAVISDKRNNSQMICNSNMNYLAPISIIIDEFQKFLTNLKAKLNSNSISNEIMAQPPNFNKKQEESKSNPPHVANLTYQSQKKNVTFKPQQSQSIMKKIKAPSTDDDDLEFNNFLKNIKNSDNKHLINENPFLKASSNKMENNNNKFSNSKMNIGNNVNDDEFDNFMKTFKNKKIEKTEKKEEPNPTKSLNNITTNDKEEVDSEFDTFLNNINNKKVKKAFNPPQLKKANETNLIKSDFMSGNSKVNFKPNDKIKNLLCEMEKDCESEFDITGNEETKKYKVKENITKNNISNISNFNPGNINKSSSKKIKINDFATDKLNVKRLFSEHVKSLNPETQKSIDKIMPENNKKLKTIQNSKISENMKKVKFNPPQLLKTTTPINLKKDFFLSNISSCGYLCICAEYKNNLCTICNGSQIITISNFVNLFIQNFKERQLANNSKIAKIEFSKIHTDFLKYLYKLSSWKYYILSKYFEDPSLFSLKNVLKNISHKFKIVFEEGKRSFLTKVAEKDSSINRNMILLVLDVKTFKSEAHEDHFIIEMTDGYKSVFSEIQSSNPISLLLKKESIIPGMKLNIGLAKVERVTDDFEVFINIYYNSLSKADSSAKLGPNLKNKFLIKNLSNLREDGGEISLIDVVILKKYCYHVFDFVKKEKVSASKFEKLIEDYNFNEGNNMEVTKTNNKFPYENVHYVFKIVCADSLLQLDNLYKIMPNHTSNLNLSKKFSEKLLRKCVIEFTVKNKEIFDSILNCKRYQFGLLNLTKKNNKNHLKNFNDPRNIFLKANDNVLIKEIPPAEKTSDMFPRTVYSIKQNLNFPLHEVDISEIYDTEQFKNFKLNEDVSVGGLYLGQSYSHLNHEDKSLYIFLANFKQNLILIKVHDEKFYDFTNLSKVKNENSIYIFRDVKFQILYYYNSNQLVAFNPSFKQSKTFNPKNIVIYLETQCYSTFHLQNASSNVTFNIKRALEDIPDRKLYYEEKLEEIKKCI
jgi:hypothetical protein